MLGIDVVVQGGGCGQNEVPSGQGCMLVWFPTVRSGCLAYIGILSLGEVVWRHLGSYADMLVHRSQIKRNCPHNNQIYPISKIHYLYVDPFNHPYLISKEGLHG